jgi:hypothetical protein
MVLPGHVLVGEVDWLVAIGLTTSGMRAFIDLPWAITVPDCPSAILNTEVLLETLAETPFY